MKCISQILVEAGQCLTQTPGLSFKMYESLCFPYCAEQMADRGEVFYVPY